MKTLKSLIYIGLACMMSACTSPQPKETQGLRTIHVEVDKLRDDVKLSEFAEAKLVPLPTSDEMLINGKFNRIKTSSKSICISDGDAIYRFSRSGEYLGKIAQKGQGPKQYLHINDFILDKDENVWVASDHKKSLLLYSWDNTVIKEIKIESTHVPRLHRIGEKLIITNAYPLPNNKHALQIIDLNTGRTTNKFLPIDEYKANYLTQMVSPV